MDDFFRLAGKVWYGMVSRHLKHEHKHQREQFLAFPVLSLYFSSLSRAMQKENAYIIVH